MPTNVSLLTGVKQPTESQASQGNPVAFAELTEAADTLQSEMDVYECTREQLLREAAGPGGTATDADGEDMFADSDEDEAIDIRDVPSLVTPTTTQAPRSAGMNQEPIQTTS